MGSNVRNSGKRGGACVNLNVAIKYESRTGGDTVGAL
jgi:hypothetical protein